MNFNKELNELSKIGDVIKNTIDKTKINISEFGDDEESKVMLGFISEMEECIKNGKGIEELKNKINDYAGNR